MYLCVDYPINIKFNTNFKDSLSIFLKIISHSR